MNYHTLSRVSFVALVLCIFLGGALYKVKHNVIDMEKNLRSIQGQINHAKDSLHLLKAEWVYLNNPQRLQQLNEKYLKLKPVETVQVASLKSIPHRSRIDTNGRVIMFASLPPGR